MFYVVLSKKGRRVWRSLRTKCLQEAQTLYEDMSQKHKAASSLRIEDLWNNIQPILKMQLSPGTAELYRQAKNDLLEFVGNKKVSSVSVIDIERLKIWFLEVKKNKNVTVNKKLRTIRAFFNQGIRLNLVTHNPAKACQFLKCENAQRCLSSEEFNQLLEVMEGSPLKNVVIVAVETAMRAGELVRLERPDLNFDVKEIAVRHKKGQRVKGGKERYVPMSDKALDVVGGLVRSRDIVFLNTKGRPYTVKALSDSFRRFRRKAKLAEGIRFHTLRHTAISWMLESGVPMEYIRVIAGHSSISVTQLYTHVSPQHLRDAVNTISRQYEKPVSVTGQWPRNSANAVPFSLN